MAKDGLEGAVCTLRLTVSLRVVGRGHGELDAKNTSQGRPKLAGEACVTVGDKAKRDAITVSEEGADKKFGGLRGGDSGEGGAYPNHLGEPANKDKSKVMASVVFGKMGEVQTHGLPRG